MANVPQEPEKKLIVVKLAALKYHEHPRNIINWIKTKKVTGSRIGACWFVDEDSLYNYLEIHKKIQEGFDRLKQINEEINTHIDRQRGFLYGMEYFEDNNPVLKCLTDELAKQINNTTKKEIFIEITLGNGPETISKKYNLSEGEIFQTYNYVCKQLFKKASIITTYRNEYAALLRENRRQAILLRNQANEIERLNERIRKRQTYADVNIPDEAIDILSKSFFELGFESRIITPLHWGDMKTLEDFLRFVKRPQGWENLLRLQNLGQKGINRIIAILKEKKIIDDNLHSEYFKYLC